MLLIENIKLAVNAIKINKMRSFLTMLGIIIGISSVIAISSIGASAQKAVEEQFNGVGAGYVYLMPNWYTLDTMTSDMMFTMDDIEALEERFPNDIKYAAPYAYSSCETQVGRTDATLSMMGVNAHYNEFATQIQIVYGRMVNERDVEGSLNSIVIPIEAAKRLYGKENAVGETLPAEAFGSAADFTIVGVYDIPPSIFNSLDTSTRYTCYVPYSSMMRSDEYFDNLELYVDEDKDVAQTAEKICRYLERIKRLDEDTYIYQSAEDQLVAINQVLGYLSLAIGAIAAISLLVGGIGIMNIMLVSVTERTREIGIRKSLGARTKDILTQFLIEAMILAVIGGIIGTALGIGVAALGTSVAGTPLALNMQSILLAVAFSAGVGLCFGFFPARKAARLDPIEALRYE